MTYDVGIKAEGTEMNVIKAKMQLEPKKKNSRSEMNVSGTEVVVYDMGGKIAGQLKILIRVKLCLYQRNN